MLATTDIAIIAASSALGFALWPLLEYAIHGWLSHRFRTFVSPLHFQHHREPRAVFTSALAWVPLTGLVAAVAVALVGPGPGLGFTAGLLAGFLHYEYVHWRIHFRAPRNAREARLRAHHLAHHFVRPASYHGVTTPFWDRVFGTLADTREADYARASRVAPLDGASNLGRLWPRGVDPDAG